MFGRGRSGNVVDMKRAALGLTVVVALSMGLSGCGSGLANRDGGGGQGGGATGQSGGVTGSAAGRGGNGGSAVGKGGSGGAAAGTGGAAGGTGGASAGSGGETAGTGGVAGRGGGGGSTAGTGGATAGAGSGGNTGGGSGGAGATGAGGAAGGGGSAGSGGAGGSGATCDGTAPCGGNLVGTWNFVSVCLNDAALMEGFMVPNCPEATLGDVTATRTGSLIFTATDYAAAGTLSISYTMTLPASCIESGAPCSDFGDALAASASVESAYCAGDTTCVCPIVTRPSSGSESGTYTTSGSMLNLSPANGTPSNVSYCVQGDRVHLLNVETITDMGVQKMRTRSDQVAQRQ